MKKITKLMLTLALCVLGVGSANAKKYYADLSTAGAIGNATWTSSTNTFAWTAGSYAYMVVPGGSFSGDLSEYTTIGLTVSDIDNAFRVDILANGKTFTGKSISTNGVIVLDIFNDFNKQWAADKITKEDLEKVEAVRLNTNSESGSAIITKFYIAKPLSLSFDVTGEAEIPLSDLVVTGGLSFDDQTGVLTNDGTGGTLKVNMPADGIDFSHFTSLTVNRSGDDLIDRSEIKDEKNSISNGFWGSKYSVNFTTGDAMKFNNATNVNTVVWYGNNTEGTMTISSVKIHANVLGCTLPGTPIALNTLQYYSFPGNSPETATWNVGKSNDTYYGSGSSDANHYVDLTDYEELRIYRDDNTGFRAFFINAAGTGTNNIYNGSTGIVSWKESENYWLIDLSKVEKYNGNKVYLNTIKSASYGLKNIVNNIAVYKTPVNSPNYILTGYGVMTDAASSALADANATSYDATGVTGTGVTLTPTNPNALFIANAGALANAQNVIVDGTCANLVLSDGHPFKAPANFTATAASYSTTINDEAKAGTLCLPFAATIPEGVEAYTLTYTSGATVTATKIDDGTIPANTPVLLNGEGDVTFTGAGAGAVNAAATNAGGALTGVFEKTPVPVNSFVLQNGSEGVGFYKVASTAIYANPFRAYLTAQAEARCLNIVFADEEEEVTGIQTVKTASADKKIFNLNGQRMNKLNKGLNIIGGKKLMVK